MKTRFNFWLEEKDFEKLKKKAREDRRSIANYIRKKLFNGGKDE